MFSRIVRFHLALAAIFVLHAPLTGCGEPVEDQDPAENNEPEEPGNNEPHDIEKLEAAEGDLMPRYAPGDEDFYRMPWPSDARVTEEGTIDIGDIPNSNQNFVRTYVRGMATVRGFSTMPVAYVPFTTEASLTSHTLPDPAETLEEDADVQLIELSEEGCGQRIPLEVVWDEEGDEFIDENTLKMAPIPGWILRPTTTYAFVVTTGFGGRGSPTGRPQGFADHFNGDGANEALSQSFEPLKNCLEDAGLSASQLAVATVFTTQDPVEDTRRMRDAVWSDETTLHDITGWREWSEASTDAYTVYRGTMKAPIFQVGRSPYSNQGGLEFDEEGRAVIQRYEEVPFSITVPKGNDGPLDLLVWEDGTGANLSSHVGDAHLVNALSEGFAVAAFVAQFHQGRENATADPTMDTFNYFNPISGRTVFRQQVAETSFFVRLLEEKVTEFDELPEIDTSRIYFGGHSQGALVGAMVAGVEPRIDTYVLNGVGSYLTETVVFRKEPFDVSGLVESLLDVSRPIDRFHPIVQMAQLGADVVDPHNYAPYWRGWGDGEDAAGGASIFMINGQHDETTSTLSMNALLAVADMPHAGQPGWDLDPWDLRDVETTNPPVDSNRESTSGEPLTHGAYFTADQGHFTIFYDEAARDAAVNFWTSSAAGNAVIDF